MTTQRSISGAPLGTSSARGLQDAAVPLGGLFVLGWGSNQFAPLLLFYPQIAPIGDVEIQGVFVSYVLTLFPMLLLGGWLSDRIGRPRVLTGALIISLLSSGLLLCGGTEPWAILAARALSGVSAGIGFSSATAWATELLPAPRGSRLSVVFMTAGLGTGPLVAGMLSAALLGLSTPAPQVWVMVPHLLLTAVVLALMLGARPHATALKRTAGPGPGTLREEPVPCTEAPTGLRDRRFSRVLLPLAPWTLACTALPLATLPTGVDADAGVDPLLFSAFLTPLPALGAICMQPIAGQARITPERLALIALAIAAAALGLSVLAVQWQSLLLMFIGCLVFGLAHGFCQTSGLRIITAISPPAQLGRNTAVFQALSYLGFLAPFPVALLAQHVPLPMVLLGILGLAVLTFIVLLVETRRRPTTRSRKSHPSGETH